MKYFGTDGIRGKANEELNFELVSNVARGLAQVLKEKYTDESINIIIGNDTRKSGDMIKNNLISNLLAFGINVYDLDVITTPGVSFLTEKNSYIHAGIMISASHNPYYDNGIKIFDKDGKKLINESEEEIEKIIDDSRKFTLEYEVNELIGKLNSNNKATEDLINQYKNHLIESIDDLSNIKIALDTANGSTYKFAEEIFTRCGANVEIINDNPNGLNINDNAGSMHPEILSNFVKDNNFDFGFCFDGDGDRCIAIDKLGNILDGDYELLFLALKLKEEGKLKNNTVVGTVMSNLGFDEILKKHDINVVKTDVGDKYVSHEMFSNDYNLGGEQSGHIIYREYANTGDGILSALQMSSFLKNKDSAEISSTLIKFPQVLINVPVRNKVEVMENENWLEQIKLYEEKLSENGRILIRASGTENLIRIMVEAKDEVICNEYANELKSILISL